MGEEISANKEELMKLKQNSSIRDISITILDQGNTYWVSPLKSSNPVEAVKRIEEFFKTNRMFLAKPCEEAVENLLAEGASREKIEAELDALHDIVHITISKINTEREREVKVLEALLVGNREVLKVPMEIIKLLPEKFTVRDFQRTLSNSGLYNDHFDAFSSHTTLARLLALEKEGLIQRTPVAGGKNQTWIWERVSQPLSKKTDALPTTEAKAELLIPPMPKPEPKKTDAGDIEFYADDAARIAARRIRQGQLGHLSDNETILTMDSIKYLVSAAVWKDKDLLDSVTKKTVALLIERGVIKVEEGKIKALIAPVPPKPEPDLEKKVEFSADIVAKTIDRMIRDGQFGDPKNKEIALTEDIIKGIVSNIVKDKDLIGRATEKTIALLIERGIIEREEDGGKIKALWTATKEKTTKPPVSLQKTAIGGEEDKALALQELTRFIEGAIVVDIRDNQDKTTQSKGDRVYLDKKTNTLFVQTKDIKAIADKFSIPLNMFSAYLRATYLKVPASWEKGREDWYYFWQFHANKFNLREKLQPLKETRLVDLTFPLYVEAKPEEKKTEEGVRTDVEMMAPILAKTIDSLLTKELIGRKNPTGGLTVHYDEIRAEIDRRVKNKENLKPLTEKVIEILQKNRAQKDAGSAKFFPPSPITRPEVHKEGPGVTKKEAEAANSFPIDPETMPERLKMNENQREEAALKVFKNSRFTIKLYSEFFKIPYTQAHIEVSALRDAGAIDEIGRLPPHNTCILRVREPIPPRIQVLQPEIACPHCGSTQSISKGSRETNLGITQRLGCKVCGRRYTVSPDGTIIRAPEPDEAVSIGREIVRNIDHDFTSLEFRKFLTSKNINKSLDKCQELLRKYGEEGILKKSGRKGIYTLWMGPAAKKAPEKTMGWAEKIIDVKTGMRRETVLKALPTKFTALDYKDKMHDMNFYTTTNTAWGDLLILEQNQKIKRIGKVPIPGTSSPTILWAKTEIKKEKQTETQPEPLSEELKSRWATIQEIEQPFTLRDYIHTLLNKGANKGANIPRTKGFQELKTFEEEGMLKLASTKPFKWQIKEQKTSEQIEKEMTQSNGLIKNTLAKDRRTMEEVIRERSKL